MKNSIQTEKMLKSRSGAPVRIYSVPLKFGRRHGIGLVTRDIQISLRSLDIVQKLLATRSTGLAASNIMDDRVINPGGYYGGRLVGGG